MLLLPSSDYRYALRKDDVGTDVAVLQMNIGRLYVDGVYGNKTRRRVRLWQASHLLVPDGIAGLQTQQSIIVSRSKAASKKYNLPKGLLKSIASNESGFSLAAAGRHLNDNGWDIGAFCRSSGPDYPSQDFLLSAYNVAESAEWTANHVVEARKALTFPPYRGRYFEEMGESNVEEFLWKLAILSHNWPVAARNISRIGTAMLTTGADDEPQDWIISATGGRLSTPREWCMSYVARATVYVKW